MDHLRIISSSIVSIVQLLINCRRAFERHCRSCCDDLTFVGTGMLIMALHTLFGFEISLLSCSFEKWPINDTKLSLTIFLAHKNKLYVHVMICSVSFLLVLSSEIRKSSAISCWFIYLLLWSTTYAKRHPFPLILPKQDGSNRYTDFFNCWDC